MGVVIDISVWEPNPSLHAFIFICCFTSITLFPHLSKHRNKSPFDHPASYPRNFLLLFSLASAMEGLWSVFGEFEFGYHGVSEEQMVTSLCIGYGAALLVGTFLGMLSDLIGHKKTCMIFCILHLFVGLWKRITSQPSIWLASICLSLATAIFSFTFEAWLVVENEKQGQRKYSLTDMFWLMTFFESMSLIGSQMLANWLVGANMEKRWKENPQSVSPSTAAIILAMIGIIFVSKGWKENQQSAAIKDYRVSCARTFTDKRIWLLGFAHSFLQFSWMVFWILWAPTLVADGREVHLGLIYPCLLGARMLGSTVFPWLLTGPLSLRTEDVLVYSFITLGLALSIVAYDYQEIGVLMSLFCLFHAGVGLIVPSLAKLRNMHVPNELRGGMISLSLAPANATILFWLIQRGYYQNIENSTMMALAALGLFMAAGCMHLLKRWGKQPYQNWHKL